MAGDQADPVADVELVRRAGHAEPATLAGGAFVVAAGSKFSATLQQVTHVTLGETSAL